jgi:hypothetical protein
MNLTQFYVVRFTGPDCDIDLCEAARCGEHGTCAAKYLGASSPLPVTSDQACICDPGWAGPLCTSNPCAETGMTCSENGQCVASSANTAMCKCDLGYSGENCETSCDGICPGEYPYGCADNLVGITKYGCTGSGACSYLRDGESFPFGGFCSYKDTSSGPSMCQCPASDCEFPGDCDTTGQCSDPTPKLDGTPCNSVPFGICKLGVCTMDEPNQDPPTHAPTGPTASPTYAPTGPTASPTYKPTKVPTSQPTMLPSSVPPAPCGCDMCTEEVLNTMAGSYSCGDRINWLQSPGGGSKTEEDACIQIGRDEFSSQCSKCDPTTCNSGEFESPSLTPTYKPTVPSTASPTYKPTKVPTSQPTMLPSSVPPAPCGCDMCTEEVLNTMAGSYSCGDRINWLQSPGGGSKTEEDACIQIGRDEFSSQCGSCDPTTCSGTPQRNLRVNRSRRI